MLSVSLHSFGGDESSEVAHVSREQVRGLDMHHLTVHLTHYNSSKFRA